VPFRVDVEEQAVGSIMRLPPPVRIFVANSLRRLELDPHYEAKPRQGPFPGDYVMELEFALGSLDFFIDVLFRFGPAADTVTVFHIAWEYV
jgi:hypothetical protein